MMADRANSAGAMGIRRLGRISLAALLLVTALSIGSAVIARRDIVALNGEWTELQHGSARKAALLNRIRSALGYGGMIHNLKNFVLRQDRRHLIEVHRALLTIDAIIDGYVSAGVTADEKRALSGLKTTMLLYRQAALRAEALIERGIAPADLDRQIRVDDVTALEALEQLDGAAVEVRQAAEARLSERVQRLNSFLTGSAGLLSLSLIALTIGLGGSVRRRFYASYQREADGRTRTRAIIDRIVDGIVVIDAAGTIRSVNPAVERIFGYQASQLAGANVRMLAPEPHRGAHDGYIANYLATGVARLIGPVRELEGQHRDGHLFPVALQIAELDLEEERLFLGVIRDLTESRRNDRLKGEFISTVSHELRTPLTSIRGALGLAKSGAIGPLNGKLKDMLEIAYRNSDRLLLLINDILDIEGIEAGKLNFTMGPVDMDALVRRAVVENRGYGEEFGITFEVSGAPLEAIVEGDEGRLMQVLSNLLSNAAKFSPTGGRVAVSVSRSQGCVRLSVADQGPGIPEAFRAKLFDKFTQADSSDTREKGGTGLGLSIARAIVKQHGGSISFDCPAAGGTTFFVDLPERQTANA